MQRLLERCLGSPDSPQSGQRAPSLKEMGLKRKVVVLTCFMLGIGAGLIMWGIESLEKAPELPPTNDTEIIVPQMTRRKRSPNSRTQIDPNCNAQIVLNYTKGATTSFTFDLCSVIDCGGFNSSYRSYDVYLCYSCKAAQCERSGWSKRCDGCRDWSDVVEYTGRWQPTRPPQYRTYDWEKISLQRDYSPTQNPLTLSLDKIYKSPTNQNRIWMVLGVEVSGTDPLGSIQINIISPHKTIYVKTTAKPEEQDPAPLTNKDVIVQDFSKMKPQDILELTTGAGSDNLWVKWLVQNAQDQKMEGCVACAAARPAMYTEPAPLYPESDKIGYHCMLNLTRSKNPPNCTTLSAVYPPGLEKPGYFTAIKGEGARYQCFNFTSSGPGVTRLGSIPTEWCNRTVAGNKGGDDYIGNVSRLGLFYYCGRLKLYAQIKLPDKTVGLCAMVRLAMPISIVGNRVKITPTIPQRLTQRRRRHIMKRSTFAFDPFVGTPTYIDAIGVPRGVPNEYKLADQISAGFESIPIISALFPITPNKNVDRINFVHYNVLRLSNATRDAIDGLAEQMAPSSLMALQNRMALDMILAEKGGVCAMFGEMCCTIIPNNTAPDGKVTRALNQLKALSREMHEASGVDNPFSDWMSNMFGKWKDLMMSLMISIAVFVAILVTCGCCCIPCLRTMAGRLISTALSKEKAPPPYSPEAGTFPLLMMNGEGEENFDLDIEIEG